MTDETGWHTRQLQSALRARGAVGRCIDLADCRIDTGARLARPGAARLRPRAARRGAGARHRRRQLRAGDQAARRAARAARARRAGLQRRARHRAQRRQVDDQPAAARGRRADAADLGDRVGRRGAAHRDARRRRRATRWCSSRCSARRARACSWSGCVDGVHRAAAGAGRGYGGAGLPAALRAAAARRRASTGACSSSADAPSRRCAAISDALDPQRRAGRALRARAADGRSWRAPGRARRGARSDMDYAGVDLMPVGRTATPASGARGQRRRRLARPAARDRLQHRAGDRRRPARAPARARATATARAWRDMSAAAVLERPGARSARLRRARTRGRRRRFLRACELDVAVRKPGNVSRASPGHGMQAGAVHRQRAGRGRARCSRPARASASASKRRCAATLAAAGCNTNLGIVLLVRADRARPSSGAPAARQRRAARTRSARCWPSSTSTTPAPPTAPSRWRGPAASAASPRQDVHAPPTHRPARGDGARRRARPHRAAVRRRLRRPVRDRPAGVRRADCARARRDAAVAAVQRLYLTFLAALRRFTHCSKTRRRRGTTCHESAQGLARARAMPARRSTPIRPSPPGTKR